MGLRIYPYLVREQNLHVTGKVAELARQRPWGLTYSLRRTANAKAGLRPRCAVGHTERGRVTPHFLMTDWRVTIGAQLGRPALLLVCVAAGLAVLFRRFLSGASRSGAGSRDLSLAPVAVGSCLLVALQPSVELGQVSLLPNHARRAGGTFRARMSVAPPDHGPSRAQRAAQIVAQAAPRFAEWERAGHRVEIYSFGEALATATPDPLRATRRRAKPPAWAKPCPSCAGAWPAATWAGVVLISDGIDTGRIARGPLDGETRRTWKHWMRRCIRSWSASASCATCRWQRC